MDMDKRMTEAVRADKMPGPQPPTLYEVVQSAAEQIDNLTQAMARVGERLSQAEAEIQELRRQVGNP